MTPIEIAHRAKLAFEASQLVDHSERVDALEKIKQSLASNKEAILAANQRDVEVLLVLPYSIGIST